MSTIFRRRSSIIIGAVALLVAAAAVGQYASHYNAAAESQSIIVYNRTELGDGFLQTVYSRAHDGSPRMIGVTISDRAMTTLPTQPRNDGNTCFDRNGDGVIDPITECAGGTERVLWFPKIHGLPFRWMMFNWQPVGHGPPHVFDTPHLDLHYFIQDYLARNLIRTGSCGLLMNCDDFARSQLPVPDPFRPIGFGAPGAAGRMGNHIADTQAPPFTPGPLTQAFAYGTYNAHISFWEPVVSTTWLTQNLGRSCLTIKWAPEVELSGYYPHQACAVHRSEESDYLLTLEGFEYRTAPVGTAPPNWGSPLATATASAPSMPGMPDTGSQNGHS